MSHTKTYKSGFTVLELIVIVCVIVLMLFVTLPMVTKYIQNGKNTDAMANTKVLFISLQATLIQNLDVQSLEELTPSTLDSYLLRSNDETEHFYTDLNDYLPADFGGEFAFTVEDGVVADVLWQNDEIICEFNEQTQQYTISSPDDDTTSIFNTGQEFDAQGVEEDDLP